MMRSPYSETLGYTALNAKVNLRRKKCFNFRFLLIFTSLYLRQNKNIYF